MAVALVGCSVLDPGSSVDEPAPTSTATPREVTTYVAMGDSYAAGPFIPVTELNTGCFRSSGNYANLVAEDLEIDDLRDVTCGAAGTKDITEQQRTIEGDRVPPQIDALDADVDLVTIGIGGNDFGLFTRGLANEADTSVITRIGRRVIAVLEQVQEAAPEALVLLVGYPRLVDDDSFCPGRLPFTPDQLELAEVVQRELHLELVNAADRTGTTYVDLYSFSEGHGICSELPWVNGSVTKRGVALAYHPLERGMRAAADLVLDAVEEAELRP